MSETKHSPAPWRWEDSAGAGLQIFAPVDRLSNPEFPVYGLVGYAAWMQFEPQWWTEMQTANARLIAASPTMFEFISRKAAEGDVDAKQIIESI